MKIRLLNASVVRELLPMEQCISLMRDAMTLVARGGAIQPIRQAVRTPDSRGLLGMMPGYTASPNWLGIKVVSVFEGNSGTALGVHQGMMLLFDPQDGTPKAIVDGREITAIRTAAASAAATDALARANAASLAIFGCGEQARRHLEALPCVRPFERILVCGRDKAKTRRFAADQSATLCRSIQPVDQPEHATDADVICTTTTSAEPFLRAAWLRPGQHINLVGSSVPTTSEVEPEVVRRSRYFADYKESALALAGEFRRARESGLVDDDHILGSIGEVLIGRVPGRISAADITVFKSLGMIAQDMLAADYVLAQAERHDAGLSLEW